jgi:hypothetical protein
VRRKEDEGELEQQNKKEVRDNEGQAKPEVERRNGVWRNEQEGGVEMSRAPQRAARRGDREAIARTRTQWVLKGREGWASGSRRESGEPRRGGQWTSGSRRGRR